VFRKKLAAEGMRVDLSNPQSALGQGQQLAQAITHPVENVSSNVAIAVAYHLLGNPQIARAALQRMLDYVRRSIPDNEQRGAALLRIADGLGQIGETQAALQMVEEGSAALGFVETSGRTSAPLRAISSALSLQGKNNRNAQLIEDAHDVSGRIIEPPFRVAALCDVAGAYASISDLDSAYKVLREAAEVAKRVQEEAFRATIFQYLAKAFDEVGEEARAAEAIQIALESMAVVPDPAHRAIVAAKVGLALFLLGQEQRAVEALRGALQYASGDPRPDRRASGVAALAGSFAKVEQWKEADRLLSLTIQSAAEIAGDWERNVALSSIVDAISEVSSFSGVVVKEIDAWSRRVTNVEDKAAAGVAAQHLQKAHALARERKFMEALREARSAQKIIQKAEYDRRAVAARVKSWLELMETNALQFRDSDYDITEFEAALAEARAGAAEKDYPKAAAALERLEGLSNDVRENARPAVKLAIQAPALTVGNWTKCVLTVENAGKGRAKRIELALEGPVDIQGELFAGDLAPGAKHDLQVGLMPKEAGSIPLKASARVNDAIGGSNMVESELWIEAQRPVSAAPPPPPASHFAPAPAQAPAPALPPPPPDLAAAGAPGRAGEGEWRDAMAQLQKATVDFEGVPVPGKVLFDTLLDIANDLGFQAMEPKLSEHSGFFRGGARLFRRGMGEGAQIDVTSTGPASKIIIRAFAKVDPQREAEELASELALRFEVEPHRKRAKK
jgi:tetratricopeptide (TPR) repeat protein